MAPAILADEISQMRPQSHVCDSGLVIAPLVHGETFEKDEPLSVDEIGPKIRKEAAKPRKRELGLVDVIPELDIAIYLYDKRVGKANLGNASKRSIRRNESVGILAQFGNLLVRELMGPCLRRISVVLGLPHSWTGDLLWEVRQGTQLFVDGILLAGRLEAIWEYIHGDWRLFQPVRRRLCGSVLDWSHCAKRVSNRSM